jgi:hypothetical protein
VGWFDGPIDGDIKFQDIAASSPECRIGSRAYIEAVIKDIKPRNAMETFLGPHHVEIA